MAQENKTRPTQVNVESFLGTVENKTRLQDARTMIEIMHRVTGEPAVMWGPSIIGFGTSHYKYDSGREGDVPLVGFSPRKANLVLYLGKSFDGYDTLIAQLGKHKTGASCLYINKLADVDLQVLETMVDRSAAHERAADPS
ncbi:MAG: DUF1801 domain-containing protein [Pseudomonadota bacterium]